MGDINAYRKLCFTHSEALMAYHLLYPEETLTQRRTLLKVAAELETPIEILNSLVNDSASSLLASESSASNPSEWTLEEALSIRDAFIDGSAYLPITKNMSETEGRLFWSSVMGDTMSVNRFQFLRYIGMQVNVDIETIQTSRGFLTDEEVIQALYRDINALHDPKKWWEKPSAALRKRRYLNWSKHKQEGLVEYNGGVFQNIPHKSFDIEYDEEERILIERSGDVITDVAYPTDPQLGLRERLVMYADAHEDALIAWPEDLKSWKTMIKMGGVVRFPNINAFDPTDYGGFILVKKSHEHYLRLHSYKHDDSLVMKLSALDGLDFIDVGFCRVHILSEQSSVLFAIQRRYDSMKEDGKTWKAIPDSECIVVRVSSPFVDRRTGLLSDPTFLGIEDDLGISDITQYVDLIGVEDE
jgi:hypothetical protein